MVEGGLWRSVGLVIDGGSGVLFLALAAFVGLKRPRTPAGTWFAVFAGSLGIRAVLDNVIRLGWLGPSLSPLHTGVLVATAIGAVGGVLGVAKAIDRPVRYGWWLAAALAALITATRVAAGGGLLLGATNGTAAAFAVALWWLVVHATRAPAFRWLNKPMAPYAAAYSLIGITTGFGDVARAGGLEITRWALSWLTPVAAMVWALVLLGRAGQRRAVAIIVATGLAALAWNLVAGDFANDKGLLGATRIVAVAAIGYAIVRQRAFDIDVKVRVTLRRSIIATIFIATFAGAQSFVSEYFTAAGGFLPGAIATALLVLAIAPLQRFADGVSRSAMPDANPLDQRSQSDREDVYRRLSEAAWADGRITRKEVQLLEVARAQLGLDLGATAAIDLDVRQ